MWSVIRRAPDWLTLPPAVPRYREQPTGENGAGSPTFTIKVLHPSPLEAGRLEKIIFMDSVQFYVFNI